MKQVLAAVLLLLFCSTAHAAEQVSNQSVLKMLKAKGLITDDDIKAALQDSRNDLEFFGQFQIQYNNEQADPAAGRKGTSDILIRRARLGFKAKVTERGFINVLADFGKSTAKDAKLEDAYFGLALPASATLIIGQTYIAFDREAVGTTKLILIEQGRVAEFSPQRQLGIGVVGQCMDKKVEYQLGVYNGTLDSGAIAPSGTANKFKTKIYDNTNQTANDNRGHMWAARLEYHPFGYLPKGYENFNRETKLEVGASYYASADGDVKNTVGSNTVNYRGSDALEADVQFRTGGLDSMFEIIKRTVKWNDTATDLSADQTAYSLQASYLLLDDFSLAARFDSVNYGYTAANLAQGLLGQKDETWTTIGLNYYLAQHALKLQANYVMKKENMVGGAAEPKNDAFILQANYVF